MTSLERSIRFYTELFGLRIEARLTFGLERLVFLAAPGGGRIELIEDGTSTSSGRGPVDHLALSVADLDAALERVRAAGIELLDPRPAHVPELQARIVFCLGPDGERVELIERQQTA